MLQSGLLTYCLFSGIVILAFFHSTFIILLVSIRVDFVKKECLEFINTVSDVFIKANFILVRIHLVFIYFVDYIPMYNVVYMATGKMRTSDLQTGNRVKCCC